MNNKRIHRISEEIKKNISKIIHDKLKDPRVNAMMSIAHVDVTNDLSYAKIYVSVLNEKDIIDAIEGLESAKGFIKKELSKAIKLRIMPELIFIEDNSIKKSFELYKLIDEVIDNDNK